MKVFMIFDNHGAEAAHIIRELKKNSHEVLYWVGASNAEVKNFREIIFHHYKKARLGLPADKIGSNKYPPASSELVSRLSGVESIVMMIMNKMFHHLPFEERKHLYFELLGYWSGVLKEFHPDVIIFPLTPSANYSYLIYELAKFLGIKTIMFSDTWISDRTLIHSDLWDAGPTIRRALQQNAGKKFSLEDLSADIKAYYLKQTDSNQDSARPWYFKKYRERYQGLGLLRRKLKTLVRSIFSGYFFSLIYRFLASRLGQNTWKEYRRLQIRPDFSKKLVFLPLQFQPERSTTPHGKIFSDQILMIQTVAAALPEGWQIYVKEHPTQWWRHGREYSPFRYRGYHEKIASIPKVSLVPIEISSYDLIKNCQAVATVTGTPAWEAILRRKPAIMFGYYWYRDCPLVFKADDVASCRQAFARIEQGYAISEQDVINFLKCLDEATFHCYVDDPYNSVASGLSTNEQLNNLSNAIMKELYVQ